MLAAVQPWIIQLSLILVAAVGLYYAVSRRRRLPRVALMASLGFLGSAARTSNSLDEWRSSGKPISRPRNGRRSEQYR